MCLRLDILGLSFSYELWKINVPRGVNRTRLQSVIRSTNGIPLIHLSDESDKAAALKRVIAHLRMRGTRRFPERVALLPSCLDARFISLAQRLSYTETT